MGKSSAMSSRGKAAKLEAGARYPHTGPASHRREFSPAIPQRVALQQSPPPLRRSPAVYDRLHTSAILPLFWVQKMCQPCPRTGVSDVPGTNTKAGYPVCGALAEKQITGSASRPNSKFGAVATDYSRALSEALSLRYLSAIARNLGGPDAGTPRRAMMRWTAPATASMCHNVTVVQRHKQEPSK